MKSTIILTVWLAARVWAAERALCEWCVCVEREPIFTVSCAGRGARRVPPVPELWPPWTRGGAEVHVAVSFSGNAIHRLDAFPRLPRLTRLSLSSNHLEDIARNAFRGLTGLMHLDLSNNLLTEEDIRPEVFRGAFSPDRYEPLSILSLDLSINQITRLDPHAFEHLPDLTDLNLSYNPLKELDGSFVEALAAPRSLRVLNLAGTGISTIPDELTMLSSVKGSLQEFYLQNNKLKEVPQNLAGAVGTKLDTLNLDGNLMAELNDESLLGLTALRILTISNMTRLKRVGPSTFASQRHLQVLKLAHNPHLSDIDPLAFGNLKQVWPIVELHLGYNALSWLPESLAPWSRVEMLDLRGNPWECHCNASWMLDKLLPVVRNDPQLQDDLVCHGPWNLKGKQLVSLDNSTMCSKRRAALEQEPQPPGPVQGGLSGGLVLFIVVVVVCAAALAWTRYYIARRNCDSQVEVLYIAANDIDD